MQTHHSLTALFLGFILTQIACGPQGQVTRVIHPPLALTSKEAQNSKGKAVSTFARTRDGLPPRCQLAPGVKDSFCISCDEGGTDLERCYAFRGAMNSANCVHSADHIKCLNATPPFALNIAVKGSLEKTLMENTRVWQESLRVIAKPGLSPDLQLALEQGLEHTGKLVQALVKARKEAGWIEQTFPQLKPELRKAVATLQLQKESGQLKLIQILQVSRSMLEASGTPATLLPYWEALSVEGLDEPGPDSDE